ncbi:unnamed protein product [Soboliphyme baturini]|uniref:GYF domain-containing protein n=1 Tax=Soboliphyme baturini TaxID=241478 RepID=A0A183IFW6_9BILA|nr:unnamed protein product [Soboliphyme baturini]
MYPAWLQASYYSSIPHDEVNWAQLAQQWIAMRQTEDSNNFSHPRVPSPFPRLPPPPVSHTSTPLTPALPTPARFFEGNVISCLLLCCCVIC